MVNRGPARRRRSTASVGSSTRRCWSPKPDGRTTHYRQLATLRTFAKERLVADGGWDETWVRFVDHVVAEVMGVASSSGSRWDGTMLGRLLILRESTVAALQWCLDHDDDAARALLLVATLWGVVHQGHAEDIAELVERVVARWPEPSTPGYADAVATVATCRYMLGQPRSAIELATAALPHTRRAFGPEPPDRRSSRLSRSIECSSSVPAGGRFLQLAEQPPVASAKPQNAPSITSRLVPVIATTSKRMSTPRTSWARSHAAVSPRMRRCLAWPTAEAGGP